MQLNCSQCQYRTFSVRSKYLLVEPLQNDPFMQATRRDFDDFQVFRVLNSVDATPARSWRRCPTAAGYGPTT
jgi:hypothetical protein